MNCKCVHIVVLIKDTMKIIEDTFAKYYFQENSILFYIYINEQKATESKEGRSIIEAL